MNYCQDGIQVYYKTETKEYPMPIYGHYKLDPSDVNGRQYFYNEVEDYGIWWSNGYWFVGRNALKGQPTGDAYYATDIFCLYNLIMLPRPWAILSPWGWMNNYRQLHLKCKYH